MTPIGHFACASAVGANADLLSRKEASFCFLYYLVFLLVFGTTTLLFSPGTWAMQLHDQFGNAALLFLLIFWWRGEERQKAFLCLLIAGQILAAYTHVFDRAALAGFGSVPTGMWRPHNILHTPFAAFTISLVALPLVRYLLKMQSLRTAYFFLLLGYLLHIFADTITYRFAIYPFWPFSSVSFSLASFFQAPDAVSQFLGNPLYLFSAPSAENIDGFIVYKAEVLVNLGLFALVAVRGISKRLLRSR